MHLPVNQTFYLAPQINTLLSNAEHYLHFFNT